MKLICAKKFLLINNGLIPCIRVKLLSRDLLIRDFCFAYRLNYLYKPHVICSPQAVHPIGILSTAFNIIFSIEYQYNLL
jgi:hypothetical protein